MNDPDSEVKHGITSVDQLVRGHPGTVVTCLCGWQDAWGVSDGSAEASGHEHMLSRDPEYVIWYREMVAKQRADHAEWLKAHPPVARVVRAVPRPIHQHGCSCHIDPPCSRCVNCRHIDHPECPNDCQTCEEHAGEVE
jgi:hypothetical protein